MFERKIQPAWLELPPQIGERSTSLWIGVPGMHTLHPWRFGLRDGTYSSDEELAASDPYTRAFINEPNGQLYEDQEFMSYRKSFGWRNSEYVSPLWTEAKEMDIKQYVQSLLHFARSNTFPSFKSAVLGISVECSVIRWKPEGIFIDPMDHDAVPHLDWVVQDSPVLVALSARDFPPNLWNGEYEYRGDLQDDGGSTINYLHAVGGMGKVQNAGREVWVADARRGLHGRYTMPVDGTPFVRLFNRAFIAPREDYTIRGIHENN